METQAPPNAYQAELEQIVVDLFRSMLATEVAASEQDLPAGDDVITALMPFAGSWQGDLVLECHRGQAHSFSKRFLQSEDLDEHSEDVPSTIAELSNIIAGNLKVVLPPGVKMSTPSIIEGKDYKVRICGGKLIYRQVFATDAGPFLLRLMENARQSEREL